MNDYKQYAKELLTPVTKHFQRRSVFTSSPNDIFAVDLLDVSNISEDNDNIKFLLIVLDIYSRYVWVFPLKSKKATEVLNAFKMLKTFPENLWVDEGNEFYNKDFKKFEREHDINMYHTYSGLKSVFVERFNRTLREIMSKYFIEHNTDRYIDVLDEMVDRYNNTKHSRTKQTPRDIYENGKIPNQKPDTATEIKPKFRVGDYVRVSKFKKTFEKGYTPRFSKEVFKVQRVFTGQYPYLYDLEDLLGEEIRGKFYEQELLKTNLKDFAVVEKILGTKKIDGKKKYLVKYDGYPDKFNEYLDETQLERVPH